MKINEYFDKVYCINLTRRPEKWETSKKEFEKNGLTVERFNAIDGNPNKIRTHLTDGGVGCTMSHLEIIKLAKSLNLKNVLIFEDDVEFIENVNGHFDNYSSQIPADWGLLYFGGNHNGVPVQKISENIAKVVKTYTTHAYAVNNGIYDKYIDVFSGLRDICDVLLTDIQRDLNNSYVFQPHLAWQKANYSDILNVYANYDFLKTGYFKK